MLISNRQFITADCGGGYESIHARTVRALRPPGGLHVLHACDLRKAVGVSPTLEMVRNAVHVPPSGQAGPGQPCHRPRPPLSGDFHRHPAGNNLLAESACLLTFPPSFPTVLECQTLWRGGK